MNLFFLLVKAIVVLAFLVMFLRGGKLVWGIGLLTVTTAFLLDALLGTFDRDQLLAQLGFYFYVFAGMLFAGAALWLWGLLRPRLAGNPTSEASRAGRRVAAAAQEWTTWSEAEVVAPDTAYDRQMLYEQIRYRFGPADVRDLIFDLAINENDVISFYQDTNQLVIAVIDWAESHGQTGNLALAVERALRPVPAERLPRLEKLAADSPPTVLRHYLLAHYTMAEIIQLVRDLGIDWELIEGSGKKAKVRNLLLFLYRRNRLEDLLESMRQAAGSDEEA